MEEVGKGKIGSGGSHFDVLRMEIEGQQGYELAGPATFYQPGGPEMPTSFPHKNPETGELEEVTYWDAGEAAGLLHVSPDYLRERCRRKQWPHFLSVGHYFLKADHIHRIIELQTFDPDQPPGPKVGPRRLGVVLDQSDLAELEDVQ